MTERAWADVGGPLGLSLATGVAPAGPITQVQKRDGTDGSTAAFSVTFTTPATAGNLLLAVLANGANPGTVTPPAGFTLATGFPALNDVGANRVVSLAYKVATGGESAVAWATVNAVNSNGMILEYSGIVPSSVLDVTATNGGGLSSLTSLATGTTSATTVANALAIAVCSHGLFATQAWTNSFVLQNADGTRHQVGARILTATGAVSSDCVLGQRIDVRRGRRCVQGGGAVTEHAHAAVTWQTGTMFAVPPPQTVVELARYESDVPASLHATGGLLDAWDDQSGNGRHLTATGAQRPTTGTRTTPTGANAILFSGAANGTGQRMVSAPIGGSVQPYTILVVAKSDAWPSNNPKMGGANNVGPDGIRFGTGQYDHLTWVVSSGTAGSSGQYLDGGTTDLAWHVHTFIANGGASVVRTDGVVVAEGPIGENGFAPGIALGCRGGSDLFNPWNGPLAAARFWAGVVDAASLAAAEVAYADRYLT